MKRLIFVLTLLVVINFIYFPITRTFDLHESNFQTDFASVCVTQLYVLTCTTGVHRVPAEKHNFHVGAVCALLGLADIAPH